MISRFLFFVKAVAVSGLVTFSSPVMGVNDWVWLGGDSTLNLQGQYPESPGGAGSPGARQQAAQWTDNEGNLWMFGGRGIGSATASSVSPLADMWKFVTMTQTWIWMGGRKVTNANPTYPETFGQQGLPGARYGGVAWKDTSGNLWMYGGVGVIAGNSGLLGDLWKYNIQTNIWTFEGGVKTLGDAGDYSTGLNNPGRPRARYGAAAGTTNNGDFLLFGGDCFSGKLNDFWQLSPGNPTVWRWIGGSSSENDKGNLPSVYGSSGTPGARSDMAYFTDEFGHFWIFGGFGYGSAIGQRNDLWVYYPETNYFYFMNGSHSSQTTMYPNSYGEVGTMGCRNALNYWYVAGRLWITGGYGPLSPDYLRGSDFWSYTLTDGKWRWIDGPKNSSQGSYPVAVGGKGLPPGRTFGVAWARNNYQLYLFGGTDNGSGHALKDFWRRDVALSSDVEDWQLY